jgi:hypothetical protein
MKSSLNWGDAAVLFAWDQYGCSWFLMVLLIWWTPYGHLSSEAVEFAWLCVPHSKLVVESLDVLISQRTFKEIMREREREREREITCWTESSNWNFCLPWKWIGLGIQRVAFCKNGCYGNKKLPCIVDFNLITKIIQDSNRIYKQGDRKTKTSNSTIGSRYLILGLYIAGWICWFDRSEVAWCREA